MGNKKTYLSIQQRHILNVHVLNDIHLARVLANTTHTHPVRVIAPHVLHENVGCVRLRREAVISDIDAHIGEADAIDVERVHTVGVGGVGLSSVSIHAMEIN